MKFCSPWRWSRNSWSLINERFTHVSRSNWVLHTVQSTLVFLFGLFFHIAWISIRIAQVWVNGRCVCFEFWFGRSEIFFGGDGVISVSYLSCSESPCRFSNVGEKGSSGYNSCVSDILRTGDMGRNADSTWFRCSNSVELSTNIVSLHSLGDYGV